MKKFAILLITTWSTALGGQPVVKAVDTTCELSTRYHATIQQKELFHKGEEEDTRLWREPVVWLASFDIEFDKTCGGGK
jgi:hypothetical protein